MLTVGRLVNTFLALDSLPCLQDHVSGLYPEPDESSFRLHTTRI